MTLKFSKHYQNEVKCFELNLAYNRRKVPTFGRMGAQKIPDYYKMRHIL
jgi:hypothetical protein